MAFTMKNTTLFGRLMQTYADKKNYGKDKVNSYRFLFEDSRLQDHQTPAMVRTHFFIILLG
jgi:hypothetical protein